VTVADVLNPVDVEQAIRDIANEIARNVRVVSDAEHKARETRVKYDRAFASAYLAAEGPAHEKKYRAELATARERDAMEIADLAYRHAERQAKALDAKLRATQSIGASIRAMFSGATTGFGS
jgi:hypothetical protein